MFTKLALILAVVALIATAGTAPATGHYTITIGQPALVEGTVLKAGDYRLTLTGTKVTVATEGGKQLVDTTVKIETVEKKFDATVVQLNAATGKAVISEIRLGGTKTKLIFN